MIGHVCLRRIRAAKGDALRRNIDTEENCYAIPGRDRKQEEATRGRRPDQAHEMSRRVVGDLPFTSKFPERNPLTEVCNSLATPERPSPSRANTIGSVTANGGQVCTANRLKRASTVLPTQEPNTSPQSRRHSG